MEVNYKERRKLLNTLLFPHGIQWLHRFEYLINFSVLDLFLSTSQCLICSKAKIILCSFVLRRNFFNLSIPYINVTRKSNISANAPIFQQHWHTAYYSKWVTCIDPTFPQLIKLSLKCVGVPQLKNKWIWKSVLHPSPQMILCQVALKTLSIWTI